MWDSNKIERLGVCFFILRCKRAKTCMGWGKHSDHERGYGQRARRRTLATTPDDWVSSRWGGWWWRASRSFDISATQWNKEVTGSWLLRKAETTAVGLVRERRNNNFGRMMVIGGGSWLQRSSFLSFYYSGWEKIREKGDDGCNLVGVGGGEC